MFQWGEQQYSTLPLVETSDFQTIVTGYISLWINVTATENQIIFMAVHPTSGQLIILCNDLQVHCMEMLEGHVIRKKVLCTLEVENKEAFAKQAETLVPFRRMAFIVTRDCEVDVFDIKTGLFLWKTDSFKMTSITLWIRMGSYPSVGVWNKNGVWIFREGSVADKIKDVYKVGTKSKESQLTLSTSTQFQPQPLSENFDPTVEVFSAKVERGETLKQSMISKLKTWRLESRDGQNRATRAPISLIIETLESWKLKNTISDVALSVGEAYRKNFNATEEEGKILIDDQEILTLINVFEDPSLLLILFGDRKVSHLIHRALVSKVQELLRSDNIIKDETYQLIQKYSQYEDEINDMEEESINDEPVLDRKNIALDKDFMLLEELLLDKVLNLQAIEDLFYEISSCNAKLLINNILTVVLTGNEKLQYLLKDFESCWRATVELKLVIWKVLLR